MGHVLATLQHGPGLQTTMGELVMELEKRNPKRNRWWMSTNSEEHGVCLEVPGKKEGAGEQWHRKVSEQVLSVLVRVWQ